MGFDRWFEGFEFHAEHIPLRPTHMGTGNMNGNSRVSGGDLKRKLNAGMTHMRALYLESLFREIQEIAFAVLVLADILHGDMVGWFGSYFPFASF